MRPCEQLANRLDNNQYGSEVSDADRQFAIDNNLLIVHGASDDIIVLDGIINDECYSHKLTFCDNFKVYPKHVIDDFEKTLLKFELKLQETLKIKFLLNTKFPDIDGFKFFITQNSEQVEYEYFNILEDDNFYGQGLVIKY
jgi:hypothetical protein